MNTGCIFNVKFPAFNHYIVVSKENILDFKEIHEEVFKVKCHAIYFQVDGRKKKKQRVYIEAASKQMWSEDNG